VSLFANQSSKLLHFKIDFSSSVKTTANMVLQTMIVRVADSLPLAASMQEDEQV